MAAILRVAVPVMNNGVIAEKQPGVANPINIHDANTSRHVRGHPFNAIACDDDGICCTRSKIDLWNVTIIQRVVVEYVIDDFRGASHIGPRGDGGGTVVMEIAVADGRVAIHEIDAGRSAVAKFATGEGHVRFHHHDTIAVFKADRRQRGGRCLADAQLIKTGAGRIAANRKDDIPILDDDSS